LDVIEWLAMHHLIIFGWRKFISRKSSNYGGALRSFSKRSGNRFSIPLFFTVVFLLVVRFGMFLSHIHLSVMEFIYVHRSHLLNQRNCNMLFPHFHPRHKTTYGHFILESLASRSFLPAFLPGQEPVPLNPQLERRRLSQVAAMTTSCGGLGK
jgi:hypothetical protein